MNGMKLLGSILCIIGCGNSFAHETGRGSGYGEEYYINARVEGYRPAYGFVSVPQSRCDFSRNRHDRHRNKGIGGAVVGGLLGGVVGNQIGSGSGKKVATAGGVIGGAIIGQRVATRDRKSDRRSSHCRRYNGGYQEEQLVGYDVYYQLHGVEHVVRTRYEPGDTIRLSVRVRADER